MKKDIYKKISLLLIVIIIIISREGINYYENSVDVSISSIRYAIHRININIDNISNDLIEVNTVEQLRKIIDNYKSDIYSATYVLDEYSRLSKSLKYLELYEVANYFFELSWSDKITEENLDVYIDEIKLLCDWWRNNSGQTESSLKTINYWKVSSEIKSVFSEFNNMCKEKYENLKDAK